MSDTLALDPAAWDLVVTPDGNIATASAPYALAQDAASCIKTFAGELWYDTTQGVPYFEQVLGHYPPLNFLRTQFIAAAEAVPGVDSVNVFFSALVGRALAGQVQINTPSGTVAVNFNQARTTSPGAIGVYGQSRWDDGSVYG